MEDDEILQELVVEAQEHLDIIEPLLSGWQQNLQQADGEQVNQVFRSLHTIKGGFGFFGLANIKNCAHIMETLLMEIRDGNMELQSGMVVALVSGVDRLRGLIENVAESDTVNIDDVLAELQPFIDGHFEVQHDEARPETTMIAKADRDDHGDLIPSAEQWRESERLDQAIYRVRCHGFDDLDNKDRTPYDILRALLDFGDVLDASVDVSQITGLDDALDASLGYQFLFQTMAPGEMLAEILDLNGDQIVQLHDDGAAALELAAAKATSALEPTAAAPSPPTEVKTETNKADLGTEVKTATPAASSAGEVLRLPVELVDRLMDLAGELVLGRNHLRLALSKRLNEGEMAAQFSQQFDDALARFTDRFDESKSHAAELAEPMTLLRQDLLNGLSISLDDMPVYRNVAKEIDAVASELQDAIMQTRLQSIGRVFNKVPRQVRQLAKDLNKQIAVHLAGEETELDKGLVEAMADPLTHLIRNSCDHGVETPDVREANGKPAQGNIWLSAEQAGESVLIYIRDDGAGVNTERVRSKAVENGLMSEEEAAALDEYQAAMLIFHPGFSTAATVSDVSGRGVGMDVVKSGIEKLGGNVDLKSDMGKGTTITIRIPLTLAIVPGLLIHSGQQQYVMPQAYLEELVRIRPDQAGKTIDTLGTTKIYRLRDQLLPLVFLDEVLAEGASTTKESDFWQVAVVQVDGQRYGIVVDEVSDSVEIVVKPLSGALSSIGVYAGSTILGDGSIALILDPKGLISRSDLHLPEEGSQTEADGIDASEFNGEEIEIVLLEASDGGRMALPLSNVIRLDKLGQIDRQTAAGREMANYRGQVLPLIWLAEVLPERRTGDRAVILDKDAADQEVVIAEFGGDPIGIVVHRLIDIGHEHPSGERPASRAGVAKCVLIREKVTEILDIQGILELAGLASGA